MRSRHRVARERLAVGRWIAAAVLGIACAKSTRTRAARALDAATSWSAAAQMAAEQWQRRTVPRRYTVQALRISSEQLQRAHRRFARLAPIPDTLRSAVERELADAAAAANLARQAVERNDSAGITPAIDTLRRLARRLKERSDSASAAKQ